MLEEGLVEFDVSKFSMESNPCLVSNVNLGTKKFKEEACVSDLGSIPVQESGTHPLFFSIDATYGTTQGDWLQKLMSMQNPV